MQTDTEMKLMPFAPYRCEHRWKALCVHAPFKYAHYDEYTAWVVSKILCGLIKVYKNSYYHQVVYILIYVNGLNSPYVGFHTASTLYFRHFFVASAS